MVEIVASYFCTSSKDWMWSPNLTCCQKSKIRTRSFIKDLLLARDPLLHDAESDRKLGPAIVMFAKRWSGSGVENTFQSWVSVEWLKVLLKIILRFEKESEPLYNKTDILERVRLLCMTNNLYSFTLAELFPAWKFTIVSIFWQTYGENFNKYVKQIELFVTLIVIVECVWGWGYGSVARVFPDSSEVSSHATLNVNCDVFRVTPNVYRRRDVDHRCDGSGFHLFDSSNFASGGSCNYADLVLGNMMKNILSFKKLGKLNQLSTAVILHL